MWLKEVILTSLVPETATLAAQTGSLRSELIATCSPWIPKVFILKCLCTIFSKKDNNAFWGRGRSRERETVLTMLTFVSGIIIEPFLWIRRCFCIGYEVSLNGSNGITDFSFLKSSVNSPSKMFSQSFFQSSYFAKLCCMYCIHYSKEDHKLTYFKALSLHRKTASTPNVGFLLLLSDFYHYSL